MKPTMKPSMKIYSVICFSLWSLSRLSSASTDNDLLKRGEYLARAADCQVCHTAVGGQPYGGGYAIQSPFGKIYGPNISSDKQFGIGNWTDEEFIRAVREGIGKNGAALYPAMPYDAYTKMHRDDVLAIKAWLLSLPGVRQAAPTTNLPFPFNQRWGM
jgi:mono/diheme cytochrome c family protein